jgi:hypothetical protein
VIPKASSPFLRRSAGLLSSAHPRGGGVERGARLLGRWFLYKRSPKFSSYRSAAVPSISPPRVSYLFLISGKGGDSGVFSAGLGRRKRGGISDPLGLCARTRLSEFLATPDLVLAVIFSDDGGGVLYPFSSL